MPAFDPSPGHDVQGRNERTDKVKINGKNFGSALEKLMRLPRHQRWSILRDTMRAEQEARRTKTGACESIGHSALFTLWAVSQDGQDCMRWANELRDWCVEKRAPITLKDGAKAYVPIYCPVCGSRRIHDGSLTPGRTYLDNGDGSLFSECEICRTHFVVSGFVSFSIGGGK